MRHPLYLIYFVVFLNSLGFGIIFPLLPFYAKNFQASEITIGILAASFAIAQFFFSPLWGKLSDKYGRKPIIAISLLGSAISFVLFGLAKNLTALFVLRFFQGIFSGASLPTAKAYAADITSEEERTKVMGKLGACLSLGFILGPAFGGVLSHDGFSLPFLTAALIFFLNFLFVFFQLPEVKNGKKKVPLKINWLFPLPVNSQLLPYFFMVGLWSYGLSNNQVAIPLLGMDSLNISPTSIGWLFTLSAVTSLVIQTIFLGKAVQKINEKILPKIGLSIMALALFLMAFSNSFLFLALTMMLLAAGGAFTRPVLNSLISKSEPENQGVNLGMGMSFEALGRIVGPITGGFLFHRFQGFGPFWVAAFLIIIFLIVTNKNRLLKRVAVKS